MPGTDGGSRPQIVGPKDGPEPPFPIRISGPIVNGFGRGSAELGIPTANIPIAGLSVGGHEDIESGVYYGWCGISVDSHGGRSMADVSQTEEGTVWEMVMSIGWNPVYQNSARSVEVHIMHDFQQNFYGARMNLVILGFIRPELDYVSKEKLVEDIRFDIEVARRSLARQGYLSFKADNYLLDFVGPDHQNAVAT